MSNNSKRNSEYGRKKEGATTAITLLCLLLSLIVGVLTAIQDASNGSTLAGFLNLPAALEFVIAFAMGFLGSLFIELMAIVFPYRMVVHMRELRKMNRSARQDPDKR